ncbi:hypothetical protein Ccrd_015693 [Cynara cardunculus var. scolymus]|uniref:Uncharacterized protein n=1 Tax=Cynara cardunculus var. scolymus TaxID=59895 RepID=A0A103YBF6_CYNCS|nr:hypothetical protein Ccrd_015693 [Cynara cardunculus var. scolymus]
MNRCSPFIIGLRKTCSYFLTHYTSVITSSFPQSPQVSGCRTFMEVVKAIASQGSASLESVALKADDKSYGYNHLVSSARRISLMLSGCEQKIVDWTTENRSLNGARIGVVAKPSAEFVAGVLAIWLSGGVAVPLALSYPEAELLHVMTDSDVSMILSTEDHSELMQKIAAKTAAQFALIPHVPSMTSQAADHESTDANDGVHQKEIQFSNKVKESDPALILYTSGTTGKPKGVVHTHSSILAQVEFMPKFSVRGIWQRWRESYPKDGTKLDNAITFVMAISNPLKGIRKGGTVGKPFPGVQVKILAEDDGGEGVGELCIKSPSLFKEYWKRPEVTKESFIEGGFFKTGDAVKVDEDGYYVILGRTNADIMKVGGYKLSALEIEAILLEHPAVSECCVLGLPDNTYGEAVTAIIVPDMEIKKVREKDLNPAISLDELRTWAKEKLAPYKIPTRLFLWDSLPRNAMGKVNKKELKMKLAAEEQ